MCSVVLFGPVGSLIALGGTTVQAQGAYQIYQYDLLGNLVGAADSAGRNAQLHYDPAENRTSVTVTVGPVPPAPPSIGIAVPRHPSDASGHCDPGLAVRRLDVGGRQSRTGSRAQQRVSRASQRKTAMKASALALCALMFGASSIVAPAHAAQWTATIANVQPPNSLPCFVFSLNGVSQADPVVPGSPNFSVPRSNPAYQEMYAAILSAGLSGKSIYVVTTGTISCGFAEVAGFYVIM
jgi:YD repeat-containing protein